MRNRCCSGNNIPDPVIGGDYSFYSITALYRFNNRFLPKLFEGLAVLEFAVIFTRS